MNGEPFTLREDVASFIFHHYWKEFNIALTSLYFYKAALNTDPHVCPLEMKPRPMKTCIRVHVEPLNLLLSRNPLLLDGNYKIGVLDETQEVAME